MAALLDGSLAEASREAGVALTPYFLTGDALRLSRRRVSQIAADPGGAHWVARAVVARGGRPRAHLRSRRADSALLTFPAITSAALPHREAAHSGSPCGFLGDFSSAILRGCDCPMHDRRSYLYPTRRPADQERSSLAAQTAGATADPESPLRVTAT